MSKRTLTCFKVALLAAFLFAFYTGWASYQEAQRNPYKECVSGITTMPDGISSCRVEGGKMTWREP